MRNWATAGWPAAAEVIEDLVVRNHLADHLNWSNCQLVDWINDSMA